MSAEFGQRRVAIVTDCSIPQFEAQLAQLGPRYQQFLSGIGHVNAFRNGLLQASTYLELMANMRARGSNIFDAESEATFYNDAYDSMDLGEAEDLIKQSNGWNKN